MATIILTGGGTAGHCTPHLAILPYIKNDFEKIYYIGSKNGIEKDVITPTGIPFYSIPCAKLRRNLSLKNLTIPFKVVAGILKAGNLLDKLKPDVIFSKGGYVSLPTVIAAKQRGIPVVAHESDYSVGLANKISARYCKKILTSFPDTAKNIKNGEYVGSPLRKSLFNVNVNDAYSKFGFSGQKPVLLITGGSQGASAINKAVRDTLKPLLSKFDILHICGKGNLIKEKTPKGYFQTEFLNDVENAFAIASVCITRAGANTLFELLALKIPCLLIPLPTNASRGDQLLNARYFQKQGLVSVLPQEALTPQSLLYNVNCVYSNRLSINKNLQQTPIKDASRQISRILVDCYQK